jgi:hypothetical protein
MFYTLAVQRDLTALQQFLIALQQCLISLAQYPKLSLFHPSTFASLNIFLSMLSEMKTETRISETRLKRIRAQGYTHQTNQEIGALAFGNRFAFQACTSVLVIGVAAANIPLLTVMLAVALLGVMLPNHPFDYIYNHAIAPLMHKPRLPKRSAQLKFACSVASLLIMAIIGFFYSGNATMGYITGGILAAVAFTVATTDFCIPSMIYNTVSFKLKNHQQVRSIKTE